MGNRRRWVIFLGGLIAALSVVVACAGLPRDYPRTASIAFDRPGETRLGRVIAPHLPAEGGKSGLYVLDWGVDAFVARASLMEVAEKSIDLQYYIIHLDSTGNTLLRMVLEAADRGVRVRILVDDMYTGGEEGDIAAFAAHPNIEVRLFNPFSGRSFMGRVFDYVADFSRVQRRMHNKLFLVDGAAAIVGGRNIGDEYFAARGDVNFADLDLLAVGPVVQECGRAFDRYWNSELAIPAQAFVDKPRTKEDLDAVRKALDAHWRKVGKDSEYVARMKESDILHDLRKGGLPFVWAPSRLISDPPEKLEGRVKRTDTGTVWSALAPYARECRSELILISPYFVPGRGGVAHVRNLRDRGVNVRILTNSLASNDVGVVHAGYSRYRKDLLEEDVELYEVRAVFVPGRSSERRRFGSAGAGLHAKAFVYDRKTVFVGSANLDPRSGNLNTEMGLVVESPEIARRMALAFDRLTEGPFCFRVELEKEVLPDGTTAEGDIVWIGKEGDKEVRYDTEPLTGFWKRLSTKIMGFFTPERML